MDWSILLFTHLMHTNSVSLCCIHDNVVHSNAVQNQLKNYFFTLQKIICVGLLI